MVSVVDIAGLCEVIGVRRVNKISYLVIFLLVLDVLVLIFDLGFNIEEGAGRILLSPLAAAGLRMIVCQRAFPTSCLEAATPGRSS